MNKSEINTWQAVETEVRRRIRQRDWKPGDFIPHESDLAKEFGCARATVNRALRGLAEAGLLERRRRLGTRVSLNPVRRAQLNIPVIRDEIESKGQTCRHMILVREMRRPPPDVRARMQRGNDEPLLYFETLYTADGAPYVFETRWINPAAVPAIADEPFDEISPNEWLVHEVPFDGGDFTFCAITSGAKEAEALGCATGQGLLVLDRTTHAAGTVITSVRLTFHPGYRIHTEI